MSADDLDALNATWNGSEEQKTAVAEALRMWPEKLHLGKFDGLIPDAQAERMLLIQRAAYVMGAKDQFAALSSVRAELVAANTRIDTAKAALEISEPVHHAMLCGASRGPNDSCFHPACSCACHGPVRVPVQWLAARRALGGDC